MKWISSAERKFFPHDSAFQRIRRRRAIILGLVIVPLLVVGVAKTIIKFSSITGRAAIDKDSIRIKKGWQNK